MSAPSATTSAPNRRRIWIAWGLVVAWAGVIWMLGGDGFSARETGSVFSEILEALGIELSAKQRLRMILLIRKSAHLVEYAILALLTFRAAWISAAGSQFATAAWSALFAVATLATADEARQSFSPSRTGSPVDVLIDVTGGAIAIIGLLFVMRRLRRTRKAEESPT